MAWSLAQHKGNDSRTVARPQLAQIERSHRTHYEGETLGSSAYSFFSVPRLVSAIVNDLTVNGCPWLSALGMGRSKDRPHWVGLTGVAWPNNTGWSLLLIASGPLDEYLLRPPSGLARGRLSLQVVAVGLHVPG